MSASTFPFPTDALPVDRDAGSALPAALLDALTAQLAALLGGQIPQLRVSQRAGALPHTARACERSDGLVIDLDIPANLAEALASLRLGGDLVATPGVVGAASVRRAADAVETAVRSAANAMWLAPDASWHVAAAPSGGPSFDIMLTVGALSATIGLGFVQQIARVPNASPATADAAWQRGMRALIGATGLPLRAILHERLLPLAEAIRLAPGDVLPIEAPREVQLRIGTHRLARGTVAPMGDDGALLVTITNRRSIATREDQP